MTRNVLAKFANDAASAHHARRTPPNAGGAKTPRGGAGGECRESTGGARGERASGTHVVRDRDRDREREREKERETERTPRARTRGNKETPDRNPPCSDPHRPSSPPRPREPDELPSTQQQQLQQLQQRKHNQQRQKTRPNHPHYHQTTPAHAAPPVRTRRPIHPAHTQQGGRRHVTAGPSSVIGTRRSWRRCALTRRPRR